MIQKRSRLSGTVQERDRLIKINGFYLNLWKPAQAGASLCSFNRPINMMSG
ncbi:MAG: hypothetical protein RID09_08035 [Coleofasciculus sp. G1-WW12-02]|uniref:hypothetical protein n=1 Tax=Coleofasciculus sp. G1-WW12-02 TaxID=3068483 RepID=UPI0033024F73